MSTTLSVPVSVATEKGKEPKAGSLEVHDTQLRWLPDGQAPVVLHVVDDIHDMFVSKRPVDKPGKPRMKLDLKKKEALVSWFVDFAEWSERDRLVERLKDIRSKAIAGPTPQQEQGFQPEVPLPDVAAQRALALSTFADLRALHTDVVKGGLMAEDEFWHDPQRKRLLEAVKNRTRGQPMGMRSSFFTADLVKTRTSNHITFHLDKQTIEDIFRELPQVKHAFMERVPEKMSEAQFWEAFFKSHHFNRQEKRKDDIFLEAVPPPQDAPHPGVAAVATEDPSLALHHTEEGPEGYGLRDYEKGPVVPGQVKLGRSASHVVIEQFNRHSTNVLLNSMPSGLPIAATSPAPSAVSPASSSSACSPSLSLGHQMELEPLSQRVAAHSHLEDLEEAEAPPGIPLTVQDRNRYFGRGAGGADPSATGRVRQADTNEARRKLLAAIRSLTGGPAQPVVQGAVKLEGPPETPASPPAALFPVMLMDAAARTRTRHVLEDLLGVACQDSNKAQERNAVKGEADGQLDARTSRVLEVLRYFWGVSLLHNAAPERKEKLERLATCMTELHSAVTADLAALPATPPDPRQASLELLQSCLVTAMARAKQDQWDLQVQQGTAQKRPSSSLEGPRASVVMKMKSRRTAVT